MVKNPSASAGDLGSVSGQEDPLEKEMAAHSSTFAWEIPRTRSLVGYSPWGRKRVRQDLVPKQGKQL